MALLTPLLMLIRVPKNAQIWRFQTLFVWLFLSVFIFTSTTASDQVPHKGSAIGMVTEQLPAGTGDPMLPFGAPFLLVKAEAVGNFTHVGKSSVALTYMTRLALIDGEIYVMASGTYTATAADGSTITGPFTSKQLFGAEEFTAEVAVAGGTGRFANAYGALTAAGKTFSDGSFCYDLVGVISSTGKAKR